MAIRSVLVVDDSKTDLMYLSIILEKAGYVVITAQNADEAQHCLERGKPDLILMDVVMPGRNGYQLTRSISRDPRFSDVPIVIYSGKGQETDRIWGLRQGAQGYLVKPVSEESLLRQIEALG